MSFALLLTVAALSRPQRELARADDARAPSQRAAPIRGEHEASAAVPKPGLELELKRGFAIKLRALESDAPVTLRIAKERALGSAVAPEFVPIGPTVELVPKLRGIDAFFSADKFRVRAGHRLVLAVEQSEPCADEGCWQLVPASYENGRCIARSVAAPGRRLQFGSLPEP